MYRLRDNVRSIVTADGAVLLDVKTGKCHVVNGVGSRMLSEILGSADLDHLCQTLTTDFDATAKRIRADAESFVQTLVDKGLLERDETTRRSNLRTR
jgi:hypothetical protein